MAEHAEGIELDPAELIAMRPERAATGFAPGGRVRTHLLGTNRSVFYGRGMEYAESRAYQPGDEPRSIDWRLSARTGRAYTKLYHEERERPVMLLVDLRAAMQFGTRRRFKANLAGLVAAELAWTAHDGGDRLGAFVLGRAGLAEVAPSRTRSGLMALFRRLVEGTRLGAERESEPGLALGLRQMARGCRPGTLVFVISDFADLDAGAEAQLTRLARHGHVTLIAVADPMEAALPRRGGRLSDGAGAVAVSAIPAAARRGYEAERAAAAARLERLARKGGMVLHRIETGDEPRVLLHAGRR